MGRLNVRFGATVVFLGGALSACTAVSDAAPRPVPLKANFTYEVEAETVNVTSCPATAVKLKDTSEGGPTRWEWEVPGRPTSSDRNPVVRPPISPGETVTLTIWRGDETDDITKVVNYPEC
jgi:PKD repeat protein